MSNVGSHPQFVPHVCPSCEFLGHFHNHDVWCCDRHLANFQVRYGDALTESRWYDLADIICEWESKRALSVEHSAIISAILHSFDEGIIAVKDKEAT